MQETHSVNHLLLVRLIEKGKSVKTPNTLIIDQAKKQKKLKQNWTKAYFKRLPKKSLKTNQ